MKARKTKAIQNKTLVVQGLLQYNLPVKTIININGIKADRVKRYQALAIQAALNEFSGQTVSSVSHSSPAKKLNKAGNASKGYGDEPNPYTSGAAIWAACRLIGVTVNEKTTVYESILSTMGLTHGIHGEKPVKYCNLQAEINSHKKWLRNQVA